LQWTSRRKNSSAHKASSPGEQCSTTLTAENSTLVKPKTQCVPRADLFAPRFQKISESTLDARREQALALHHVLWGIFTELFEPQLGLWIGNDCNPFQRMVTAPKTLVSRLMVTLDYSGRGVLDPDAVKCLGLTLYLPDSESLDEKDGLINQALISSVHSFSARWLPLEHFRMPGQSITQAQRTKETFLERIQITAHNDVMKVITRPCYRSILALYLFGITPMSPKNKDRRSTATCLEASLRHYMQLRTLTCLLPRNTGTALQDTMRNVDLQTNGISTLNQNALEFSHLEDSAWWFGCVPFTDTRSSKNYHESIYPLIAHITPRLRHNPLLNLVSVLPPPM
jgi:hypothetical protein